MLNDQLSNYFATSIYLRIYQKKSYLSTIQHKINLYFLQIGIIIYEKQDFMKKTHSLDKQLKSRYFNAVEQQQCMQKNEEIRFLPKIKSRVKTQESIIKRSKQVNHISRKLELISPYWTQIKRFDKRTSITNEKSKRNLTTINIQLRKSSNHASTGIQSPTNSKSLKQELFKKSNVDIKQPCDKEAKHSIQKLQYKNIKVNLISNEQSDLPKKSLKQQIEEQNKLAKQNFDYPIRKAHSQSHNLKSKNVQQKSPKSKLQHKSTAKPYFKNQTIVHKRLNQQVSNLIHSYNKKIDLPSVRQSLLKDYQQNKLQQKIKLITWRYNKHYEVIKAFDIIRFKRQDLDANEISSFIHILKSINPIFERVSQLTSQVLIRFLKIKSVKKEQILYFQGKPSKFIYIVLWGEFLLKSQDKTFAKYAVPGDSMSQQLLFINQKQIKLKPLINTAFDSFYHIESSKALTQSGVLYFTKEQYIQVSKDLRKYGMKLRKDILLIQNMMKWCYSKKYNARSYIIC